MNMHNGSKMFSKDKIFNLFGYKIRLSLFVIELPRKKIENGTLVTWDRDVRTESGMRLKNTGMLAVMHDNSTWPKSYTIKAWLSGTILDKIHVNEINVVPEKLHKPWMTKNQSLELAKT